VLRRCKSVEFSLLRDKGPVPFAISFRLTPLTTAGLGDIGEAESSRSRENDVGGSFGAVRGLMGGVSTGGVDLTA
jgi:hypothetical protein